MERNNIEVDNNQLLFLRRMEFLLDSCEKPIVILDEEGCILEANNYFQQIVDLSGDENFKMKPIFLFFDEKTNKEIKKILKHRSSITSFSFRGHLLKEGQENVPVNISTHYIASNENQYRELILLIEPEHFFPSSIMDHVIHYLGKVILPQFPLTSQIIDVSKKVQYSINWNELPLELQNEIKGKERVCCHLIKKDGKYRDCICEKTLKEGITQVEEISVSINGKSFWLVFVTVPLLDVHGNVQGIVSTINNITEERRLRQNIEEYIKQSQYYSTSSQLAIALARHLKNPLTVIMGSIDLLEHSVKDVSLKTVVEKLKNNCEKCKDIINQIFDFSTYMPPVLMQAEVNAIIRSMVLPVFTNSEKEVIFRFYPSSVYIQCIPHQFAKVCVSIIENAVRYANKEVIVAVHPQGKEVTIEIYDDGCGVDEKIRNKIFDPFFTTEDISKHTGLGLTLSKTVIESFGGRIEVGKSPLGGANFIIYMPIMDMVDARSANTVESDFNQDVKKKILVIEDEEDLLDLITLYFKKQGFEVKRAISSDEAFNMLSNSDYDVIILDLQLPGKILGYQIYDYIKERRKGEVIVITADTINIATQHFLKRTNCDWLEKPFQIEELNILVHKKLNI